VSLLPTLIQNYLAGPELLRKAVEDMTPEQLVARPIAGKWSTAEVIFHLADFETVYVDRIKRGIALKKSMVFVADENEYVKYLAYDHRDVHDELAHIELTRKCLARILQNVPETVLQNTVVHNEKGLVTVESMLMSVTNHIVNHLPFIYDKRRALGLK